MEKRKYIVTDKAGPKVAGVAAKPQDILELTEEQARSELLAGCIVEEGKADKTSKPLDEKKLADLRARARGHDGAKDEAAAEASAPEPQKPAEPSKATGKPATPAGGAQA